VIVAVGLGVMVGLKVAVGVGTGVEAQDSALKEILHPVL
jgi:hypothetical protein